MLCKQRFQCLSGQMSNGDKNETIGNNLQSPLYSQQYII